MSSDGEEISCGTIMTTEEDLELKNLADTEAKSNNDHVPNNNNLRTDFVLVWSSKSDEAVSEEAKEVRRVFENNLRKEDLVVESVPEDASGLNFVKIHAPDIVLRRYAEILHLRLPMKKFEHIKEIKVEDFKIPIFSDVYHGISSSVGKFFLYPFKFDEKKFKPRRNELTAVFSRDKEYLFDIDGQEFFSPSMRSRIIEFILKRKRLTEDVEDDFAFGIDKCLTDGIYQAAYPLHDGGLKTKGSMRQLLFQEWASFRKLFKFQPLDAVRDYYGVKIGMYFAWLGFYTNLLILPSIVGIFAFFYGVIYRSGDVPSDEICADKKTRICPPCDHFCDFWYLSETCLHSKAMYLFDNESTIFFAVFMSFWAALFLEFWKRYSAEIAHRWNVTEYHPEEEHPRPEYLAQLNNVEETTVNFITQTTEPRAPFWSRKFPGLVISVSMVILMIVLGLAAVLGVILYRMSMIVALNLVDEDIIKSNASLFISATGACINLVCILIFNQIYGYVAVWLTDLELNRTQTEYDDSLSLKIYLLQFVNYYASIFYIAFFKGKFVGYPAKYNRFLGFRQEECSPGGCFMELCLQLAIIFVGKQFLLSVVEYHVPRIWKLYNTFKIMAGLKKEEKHKRPQYVHDFKLVEWGKQGLFYEYLEMVIQYGFITIFVSAFPLAPFFALLNNIFELRLDAKKLLVHHRRPVAQRVKDIGIWMQILNGLGRIAVVTNGFIIAFTSEFIPKVVYKTIYSPDHTLNGFTNFTLSYFDPKDFEARQQPNETEIDYCKYHDYRYPPWHEKKYERTEVYFHILAARLAFVVIFQNFVSLSVMAIKVIIPNVSGELRERIRREAYLTNEIVIRTELLKAKGKLRLDSEMSASPEQGQVSPDFQGDEEQSPILGDLRNRKFQLHHRMETGDITDGKIVV